MRKWIVLFLTMALFITGCNAPHYNQAQGNIADVKLKADAMLRKSDNAINARKPLVVNQGLYIDSSPISLEQNPTWFNNNVIIRGDQLPFSYYSRTVASGA